MLCVRPYANRLRAQGPPHSNRQAAELVAPIVAGHQRYAEDPNSDRGGLGLWQGELAMAYIFFRPSHRTEAYTTGEQRRRAAEWVHACNAGTADATWLAFIATLKDAPPIIDDDYEFDDYDVHSEHDVDLDDYDDSDHPPPLVHLSPRQPDDVVIRKQAFLARNGEWKASWRTSTASPALNPRRRSSQRALIDFNPQTAHRPLTAEHVRDEPGVKPIQFTYKQVEKAGRNLHDIRAPGSLPEDNRIIKAVLRHGGLHAVTDGIINASARDQGHPLARDILAGAVRAGLMAKLDPVTCAVKGRRPLGMTEKWRCLVWACANQVCKTSLDRHFTSPLPEDLRAQELRVADCEATLTAARLEADAAAATSPTSRHATAAAAAVAAAEAALDTARRPFKFVSNWCFSSKGTEKLAFAVRGWLEGSPTKGVITDDVTAMYQFTSRWRGFEFLRRRFPHLLALFRFFYFAAAVIWFGGATVPVDFTDDGRAVLGTAASVHVLRSIDGGVQGCGGATILCVGAYHEDCCEAQRLNPDVDMGGTADDFQACGELTTDTAGERPPLFKAYDDKIDITKAQSNLDSNKSKSGVITLAGDLSQAPNDIPGSPNFSHRDPAKRAAGRRPLTTITIAGTYLGQPDACSAALLLLLQAKLQPLHYVVGMRDTDRVKNAVQLQLDLIRLCAAQIPNHWSRTTPPPVAAPAFNFCDTVTDDAALAVLRATDSPRERAALALARLSLGSRAGGMGTGKYARKSPFNYTSAFISVWPTCCSAYPALSDIDISPTSVSPAVADFMLRAILSSDSGDLAAR